VPGHQHLGPAGSRGTTGAFSPAKDRALPQIGRDAAKIGSPDGTGLLLSCGGIRARFKRETGE